MKENLQFWLINTYINIFKNYTVGFSGIILKVNYFKILISKCYIFYSILDIREIIIIIIFIIIIIICFYLISKIYLVHTLITGKEKQKIKIRKWYLFIEKYTNNVHTEDIIYKDIPWPDRSTETKQWQKQNNLSFHWPKLHMNEWLETMYSPVNCGQA